MDPITLLLLLGGLGLVASQRDRKIATLKAVPLTMEMVVVPSALPTPSGGVGIGKDPKPGILVERTEANSKDLHVYAEKAGARYVVIEDPVSALIWRAYYGTTKKFRRYDNSRYQPLNPIIGRDTIAGKLKRKFADMIEAVGAFFVGKWYKAGQEIAQALVNNETTLLDGDRQQMARELVRATSEALARRVAAHPLNSDLRTSYRQSPEGPIFTIQAAPGELIYIPTPDDQA